MIEVLTAYVRAHARRDPERAAPKEDPNGAPRARTEASVGDGASAVSRLAPDVQAAMTVVGRRRVEYARSASFGYTPLNLADVVLDGVDLANTKLQFAELSDALLQGANLSRADLPHAALVNAQLIDAFAPEVRLVDTVVDDAVLRGATLERADLRNARFRRSDLSGAHFFRAGLSNAHLCETDLAGGDLREANLSFAELRGANLPNADLSRANLSSADLTEANLSNADLTRANLSDASLWDANLSGAKLGDAGLSDASLSDAEVSDIRLEGALYTEIHNRTHGRVRLEPSRRDTGEASARVATVPTGLSRGARDAERKWVTLGRKARPRPPAAVRQCFTRCLSDPRGAGRDRPARFLSHLRPPSACALVGFRSARDAGVSASSQSLLRRTRSDSDGIGRADDSFRRVGVAPATRPHVIPSRRLQ